MRLQDGESWDAALDCFEDASIYQTKAYGVARWGEQNLSHAVLLRDGAPVAMAQIAVARFPGLLGGIAYVLWGPVWKRRGPSGVRVDDYREMLNALFREYSVLRGLRIVLRGHGIRDADEAMVRMQRETGYCPSVLASNYDTFRLDLRPTVEALRKGLKQKWRNRLNRAERNSLRIDEGASRDEFVAFRSIYDAMLSRKRFVPGVNADEIERTLLACKPPTRMNVVLVRSVDGLASGAVYAAVGGTGVYLLGATNELGMRTQASHLVQWHVVQSLKRRGCSVYDLGGADAVGNPGVYEFKAGLSGAEVAFIGQCERGGTLVAAAALVGRDAFKRLRRFAP